MKVSLNTLKLFIVIAVFLNVSNVEANQNEYTSGSLIFKYTEDGVYRQNNECDLTFVNFGTHTNLNDGGKIDLSNKKNRNVTPFDVTIKNLINGNIGLNNNTVFSPEDVIDYLQITQKIGDEVVTLPKDRISVTIGSDTTKFNLMIKGIDTCEGIVIKQLFKEETVVVANRLYYINVIPEDINHAFDSNKFGPSLKYPFNRIHWKINEGLDDLRKTCGIYMYYKKYDKLTTNSDGDVISPHWEYYLSPSNDDKTINTKDCTPEQFFEVIKRNYIDYHYTEELLGKDYLGYVLKREGHVELHMDGVIVNNGYLIEMYQNSCNAEFEQQTSCTIKSDDKLTFNEFVMRYSEECLNMNLEEEQPEWVIKNGKATGTFKHQIITIERPASDKRGSLPKNPTDLINYEEFNSNSNAANFADATPVARFTVSFECRDGTFMNHKCVCELCPINCSTCTSRDNCTACKNNEASELVDGQCKNKPGYFVNENGENTKCEDDCKTCDIDGCLTCEDSLKVVKEGRCVCPTGYYEKADKTCGKCVEGCDECNEDGTCIVCSDSLRTPFNGVCECKMSYYEDPTTGKCEQCSGGCAECNRKGSCTVCKDKNNAFISDGVCICKSSFLTEDGTCFTCDAGCLKCDKDNKCLACVDRTKQPSNGKC